MKSTRFSVAARTSLLFTLIASVISIGQDNPATQPSIRQGTPRSQKPRSQKPRSQKQGAQNQGIKKSWSHIEEKYLKKLFREHRAEKARIR